MHRGVLHWREGRGVPQETDKLHLVPQRRQWVQLINIPIVKKPGHLLALPAHFLSRFVRSVSDAKRRKRRQTNQSTVRTAFFEISSNIPSLRRKLEGEQRDENRRWQRR